MVGWLVLIGAFTYVLEMVQQASTEHMELDAVVSLAHYLAI